MNYGVGAQRVLEGERGTEMKTMGGTGGDRDVQESRCRFQFLRLNISTLRCIFFMVSGVIDERLSVG